MKKKEIEKTLSLEDIPSFIAEYSSAKNSNSDIEKIKKLLGEIKQKSEELKTATLRNEKIQKRMIQIMEGNRGAYVGKIWQFIDSLQNVTENMESFVEAYKSNVETFNRSTARAFYVLREFFGDIITEIATLLKKLDDTVKVIDSKLNDRPSQLAAGVEKSLAEIKEILSRKDSINLDINLLSDEIKSLEESNEELEKKIKAAKNSAAYKELQEKNDERTKSITDLNSHKEEFTNLFAKLESAFKKFEHITQNKLVKNYISDPIETIKSDSDFQIFSVLDELKQFIVDKKIQIKDKKKEITLNVIDSFTLDFLKNFRAKLDKLENRRRELNLILSNSTVMNNISELEYKKDHLSNKISRKKEEKDALEKNIHKYDIKSIIFSIESNLKELTGINVMIR